MAACNFSPEIISKRTNMTFHRVRCLLDEPIVQKAIEAIRLDVYGENMDRKFKSLVPKAIKLIEDVMENESNNPGLRVEAASKIMDRALGKPKQEVNLESNSLADFMKVVANLPKDVTPQRELSPIQKELAKHQVHVGKRKGAANG